MRWWPKTTLKSPQDARELFEKLSARQLLRGRADRLDDPESEHTTHGTEGTNALPTKEECEALGPPRMPLVLFKNWPIHIVARAAYWAYRMTPNTGLLLSHRAKLVRIAKLVEAELQALSNDLSERQVEDVRFASLWAALSSVRPGIAAAMIGSGVADGHQAYPFADFPETVPSTRALQNPLPRNVAAALLVHRQLRAVPTICVLVALELLEESDIELMHGSGIGVEGLWESIEKMRNPEALVHLGMEALFVPGLVGRASPPDFLAKDALGLNRDLLLSTIREGLPDESRRRLDREGWRVAGGLDEEHLTALDKYGGLAGGWRATTVEVVVEEVAQLFREKKGREAHRGDLLSDTYQLRPVGLRLGMWAEQVARSDDASAMTSGLLQNIRTEFGDDVALHAAMILTTAANRE